MIAHAFWWFIGGLFTMFCVWFVGWLLANGAVQGAQAARESIAKRQEKEGKK